MGRAIKPKSGRRWVRRVGLGGLALLLALQLVPVDRSNPPVVWDLGAPAEVQAVLRRACYDCHSHETRWPWYSYVAPVSWYVVDHITEARGDLNFSDWPAFDPEGQELAFADIREQITRDEMPLKSYRLMHPAARLSDEDRRRLLTWAGAGLAPGAR